MAMMISWVKPVNPSHPWRTTRLVGLGTPSSQKVLAILSPVKPSRYNSNILTMIHAVLGSGTRNGRIRPLFMRYSFRSPKGTPEAVQTPWLVEALLPRAMSSPMLSLLYSAMLLNMFLKNFTTERFPSRGCWTAVSAMPRSSSSVMRRPMVVARRPSLSIFQIRTSSKGWFRLRAYRMMRFNSGLSSLFPLMPSSM